MKDCTILLQGRINQECFNLWIENHKDNNVVVSVWEDEDLTKFKIPKKWKIVVNQYPIFRFYDEQNLDYQIITTLMGLREVGTNWVIKARCDEYWSNLDVVYTKAKTEPNKILSGSMYFRKWEMLKFHIGDKLLAGTTENIKLMFESTLHNLQINLWKTTNPEGQLGLGYVMGKDHSVQINTLNIDAKMKNVTIPGQEVVVLINKAIDIVVTEMVSMATKNLNYWYPSKMNWKNVLQSIVRWRNILDECIKSINVNDEEPINDVKYLKKWFHIIDINELKPYIATRNFGKKDGGRVWYRDNFDHDKEKCLTDINQ